MTVLPLPELAPAPAPARPRPMVKRLLQGGGANLITFTFAPGQDLPDHKAAHPILVQCVSGTLDFGCGEETVRMNPGTVIHLREYVVHRVNCPGDAPDEANILLLTMLTGERHQD
ncbi:MULTISPECIES: cupin domain-containing protein [Corynebacterium]|nr:cupin domain-containing protein [Corynebacterium casei]MDN6382860.1 cupin domain-containing protein [Corynebacterium casei]